MRASHIWFALAVGWSIDCVLSLVRRNHQQAGLALAVACCFLAAALFFRNKERFRKYNGRK